MRSSAKAVVLFSGGLDSILTVKLLQDQGISTIALHCTTPFVGNPSDRFKDSLIKTYGIEEAIIKDLSLQFLPLLNHPKHGFGSQLNPCIDCKILFLRIAKEIMEEKEASFIATGEVLGQRPFSQRREAMELIEREAGVEGILVRPLSAKLLKPTIPETKGLVKREELLDIQGRSRKRQLELAKRYGLKEIPSPAGGCLLTDPSYSERLRRLLPFLNKLSPSDAIELLGVLRMGRLFMIDPEHLLIVARNDSEAKGLKALQRGTILTCNTSTGLMIGEPEPKSLNRAAKILARYTRGVEGPIQVKYEVNRTSEEILEVTPMPPEKVEEFLVR